MLIKRILCNVNVNDARNFSEAQQKWNVLRDSKGFLGQIGGWSIKDTQTACIFSFWEDEEVYNYFMENEHDQVYVSSSQGSTFASINVDLFQKEFGISGSRQDIKAVVKHSNFFRTALSNVKKDRTNHFLEMQRTIWNPGMKQVEGMYGGEFARSLHHKRQFLVLTGWKDSASHQVYRSKYFPELRKIAEPEQDVKELDGEQFRVEESWRVCAN
ncbi:YdbC family protein [Virgibacillus ndiopensis]|uniref:YdbC family protein n=1 Tax=Virgibacillus ndiopensis TaxID=2004408 RepID=UPI000C078707|nr:YdbC family protein [Virgibacillus ndiopensis]